MKMTFSRSLACGVAILLAGGALARGRQETKAELRRAIDEGNARFLETRKRGDAAGFARVFDEGGALLTSGGEIIEGRGKIEEAMTSSMKKTRVTDGTITTIDVFPMGDLAYETGKYTFTLAGEGKAARTVAGKYVEVWKRQPDGGWKMFRDIGLPD